MIKLYHYTNITGLNGIKKDEVIRSSNSGKDSCYGQGVYLTSLNPEEHTKDYIAKNNWNDAGCAKKMQGCLDYYIEITFEDGDPDLKPDGFRDGRNIYRYQRDVILSNCEWSCGKNSEWSPGQIAAALGFGVLVTGGLALLGKYVYDKCTEEPVETSKKPSENEENI